MTKEALQIKHFNSGELKSLIRDDDNFQQAIRLFACYKVSTGMNPKEVASFFEVSYGSICDWVSRLNEGGIEALIDADDESAIGRDATPSVIEIIRHRQPYNYGFDDAKWSLPILRKVILHEFQINYKKTQIYNRIQKKILAFIASMGYTRFF